MYFWRFRCCFYYQTRLASFPLAPVRETSDTKCVGGGGGGGNLAVAGLLVCSSLRKLGISYLSGRYSLLASPGSKSEAGNHSLSHNPVLLDPHLSAGTSRQVGKEELAREEQEVELELERTLDVSVSVEVWGQRCVAGLNSSRSCTRRRLCPGSPPPPPPPQSSWSSRYQSQPRSLQS